MMLLAREITAIPLSVQNNLDRLNYIDMEREGA
jgi:hypothetical protein